MKAEHRKELQTNILADRMGRLVQKMKTKPRKRTMLYVIAGGIVLIGLFLFLRSRSEAAHQRATLWFALEDGFSEYINLLRNEHPDTNPGKSARFQFAWIVTWEGLKSLGANQVEGLRYLEAADRMYSKLADDCAGDSVWEPEARYARAVIEETRAIRTEKRRDHLDRALSMYKKIAKEFKDSAHGKEAKKRVELLENENKRQELIDFYADLESRLGVERAFKEAEFKEEIEKKLKQERKKAGK